MNDLKTNWESMESGRDNFRSRYLELREINKDLEIQVKRTEKECRA